MNWFLYYKYQITILLITEWMHSESFENSRIYYIRKLPTVGTKYFLFNALNTHNACGRHNAWYIELQPAIHIHYFQQEDGHFNWHCIGNSRAGSEQYAAKCKSNKATNKKIVLFKRLQSIIVGWNQGLIGNSSFHSQTNSKTIFQTKKAAKRGENISLTEWIINDPKCLCLFDVAINSFRCFMRFAFLHTYDRTFFFVSTATVKLFGVCRH